MRGVTPRGASGTAGSWARMSSAVRAVHCMRPGAEWDSMREAVLTVSPSSVYLRGKAAGRDACDCVLQRIIYLMAVG